MQGIFNAGQVIVILLGILVGVLFNNVRLTDFRIHLDKRFDDLCKRIDDRIARLEHPIFRP